MYSVHLPFYLYNYYVYIFLMSSLTSHQYNIEKTNYYFLMLQRGFRPMA